MENIKTLKIDGRSELSSKEVAFAPFNYKDHFPALTKLVLGGSIELNKCWKLVFPEDTQITTLKYLKLTASFTDAAWVSKIGWIFPNLTKLYFVLSPKNEPLAQTVFKSLTSLEELSIYVHPSANNLDHIFTAIAKRESEALAIDQNQPDVDSRPVHTVNENAPMTNLKKLQNLCLKGEKPTASQISDVTAQLVLLQMPSLKRLKMHPFKISTESFQKLERKFNLTLITDEDVFYKE